MVKDLTLEVADTPVMANWAEVEFVNNNLRFADAFILQSMRHCVIGDLFGF